MFDNKTEKLQEPPLIPEPIKAKSDTNQPNARELSIDKVKRQVHAPVQLVNTRNVISQAV